MASSGVILRRRPSGGHAPLKVKTSAKLGKIQTALLGRIRPALTDAVEMELAKQIRPLVDRNLTVVFYDLTTVRIHGEGEVERDIRAYGMNKEKGGIARQFVMGVARTAEGLPLMHTVHPGNVAETKTLQAMLSRVLQRKRDFGTISQGA